MYRKKNVCMMDRLFRLIVGLGLLSLPIYLDYHVHPWAWLGLIGLVPVASALLGYCPMYACCKCSACCSKGSCGSEEGKMSGGYCEKTDKDSKTGSCHG